MKKDKNIFINIGSFFFGVVIKSINERKVPLVAKIKSKIIVKLLMLFILGTILFGNVIHNICMHVQEKHYASILQKYKTEAYHNAVNKVK